MTVKKLQAIYAKYSMNDCGGDKGTQHSYIDVYGKHIPSTAKSILEIGVWEGHSLAMWEEYCPKARVVGIDITLSRVKFPVDVRVGSAVNYFDIQKHFCDDTFEYIIDDGSHVPTDQLESLILLWEKLEDGGEYFIEDIAGDSALKTLTDYLDVRSVSYKVYDLREKKQRFDDILLVVSK